MRVRVVADLVTFAPDAADEVRISLGVLTDEKKSGFDVRRFQFVEHLAGVFLGGTIVDRQRDRLRTIAATIDDRRRRKLVVDLVEDQPCLPIVFERALALRRLSMNAKNLSVPDEF